MKKNIYIGGIIMCLFLLSGCKKKITMENTEYFSFSYSVGTYINASYLYEL